MEGHNLCAGKCAQIMEASPRDMGTACNDQGAAHWIRGFTSGSRDPPKLQRNVLVVVYSCREPYCLVMNISACRTKLPCA